MRVLIVIVFLICLFEVVPLVRKRMRKELIAVVLLLLIAVIIQISKSLNIINPINIVENLVEPLGRMIFYQY